MESSRTGFLARITAMTAGLIRVISSALIVIDLSRVSCLPGAHRSSSSFLILRRVLSVVPVSLQITDLEPPARLLRHAPVKDTHNELRAACVKLLVPTSMG